jgi:ankyrin repeat protein
VDLVEYLLKKNADFKQINKMGSNIFHMCAKNQKADITRAIADRFGSKENLFQYLEKETNREKQRPLHFAAKEGSMLVADCLISFYKVNKEALDYKNRTPVILFC